MLPHRKLRTDTTDKDLDKEANLYVLRATLMPSVLIEYGFFDNYEDYKWLSDENNIDLLARCTIDGIVSANIDLYGEHIYP
jgi:N-acetylmuramoyl-L-alanine amidase